MLPGSLLTWFQGSWIPIPKNYSGIGLVILAISESASSSVKPPVNRDLYISWSRTADSSRADKPSKSCKFSIGTKLPCTTDTAGRPRLVSGGE